jgi:pimeloyl-ACP methyl ester carboxylesterase
MEEPVRVSSGSNELFGMLHTPDEGPIRAAILIANSRVEYRAGPHRFYVRAARRWAERGFAVLRLDHPGNGDSPGDEDYPHMDSFPIEPLVDAVEFLRAKSDAPNVVLAGLCMGARNALYGAARSPSVHHLLAFGMPFSDATPHVGGEANEESRAVGTAVARKSMSGYLKRMTDLAAWRRFLTGQSDYGVIKRVLPAALGVGRNRIFEEPIFRSLEDLLNRNGRVFFLFGSNDVFLADFRDQYALCESRLPGRAAGCKVEYVADANHTFSRVEWQQSAIEHSVTWLEEQFPTSGVVA